MTKNLCSISLRAVLITLIWTSFDSGTMHPVAQPKPHTMCSRSTWVTLPVAKCQVSPRCKRGAHNGWFNGHANGRCERQQEKTPPRYMRNNLPSDMPCVARSHNPPPGSGEPPVLRRTFPATVQTPPSPVSMAVRPPLIDISASDRPAPPSPRTRVPTNRFFGSPLLLCQHSRIVWSCHLSQSSYLQNLDGDTAPLPKPPKLAPTASFSLSAGHVHIRTCTRTAPSPHFRST